MNSKLSAVHFKSLILFRGEVAHSSRPLSFVHLPSAINPVGERDVIAPSSFLRGLQTLLFFVTPSISSFFPTSATPPPTIDYAVIKFDEPLGSSLPPPLFKAAAATAEKFKPQKMYYSPKSALCDLSHEFILFIGSNQCNFLLPKLLPANSFT